MRSSNLGAILGELYPDRHIYHRRTKRGEPDMNAKGSKFRAIQNSSLKTPVVLFSRKKEEPTTSSNKNSSFSKNTAYNAVSRNASTKRLSLLIKENKKTQESLEKSEEKIRLLNQQLSHINQNTCSVIGNEYFSRLVQSLASIFGMRYAFIGKVEKGCYKNLRTVALWDNNKIAENLTFCLKDTPFEKVIAQKTGFYPQEAQKHFPDDQYLVDWDIQSPIWVCPCSIQKSNPSECCPLWMRSRSRIMTTTTPS